MEHTALNMTEIEKLQEHWNKNIEAGKKYSLENDAKIRAVSSAKSYEEFSNIVKAAHLKPLTQKELLELNCRASSDFNTSKPSWKSNNQNIKVDPEDAVPNAVAPKTSAEFGILWQKCDQTGKLSFLENITLNDLDNFLRQDVPPGLLGDVTRILTYQHEKEDWLIKLLKVLVNSNRFQLNMMFLSHEERQFYKNLISQISNNNKADAEILKKEFGI